MRTELARLFDEVPDDLLAHFERLRDAPLPGLLDARAAVDLTLELRVFDPVVQALGGVILDDEDTSDHHVYLSHPALAGMVLFLAHDDDARVVFPSLEAYLQAARSARESDGWIEDFHPAESPRAADPPALAALITGLLEDYDEENTTPVLVALTYSLELGDLDLLSRLASHEDFYLGEAVANAIAQRPAPGLAPVARLCASHPHWQAANAGERALKAIGSST